MARNIIFESLTTDIIKSESTWQGFLSINDNKNINNDLVNAIINNDGINIYAVYEDNSEDELLITNKEVDTESSLKSFNCEFDGGYIRTDNITNVAYSIESDESPTKFVFYIEEQNTSQTPSIRLGNTRSSSDISKVKVNSAVYNIKDAAARTELLNKQDTLVSGTNIKTINNTSLLGSGNIDIQGGGSSYTAGTGIDIDSNNVISNKFAKISGPTYHIDNIKYNFQGIIDEIEVNDSDYYIVQVNYPSLHEMIMFPTKGEYIIGGESTIYSYISGTLNCMFDEDGTYGIQIVHLSDDINPNVVLYRWYSNNAWSSWTSFPKVKSYGVFQGDGISISRSYPDSMSIQETISNTAGMYLGDDATPGTNLIDADLLGGYAPSHYLVDRVVDSSSTSATISTALTNKLYIYTQPLTSLTITSVESGPVGIIFESGATPTTVTLPASVITPAEYDIKANKTYEFNIMNDLLVFGEW